MALQSAVRDNPVLRLERTYAALVAERHYQPVTKGRPSKAKHTAPTWTREECEQLLRLWVEAYGILPEARDCLPEWCLPDKRRIRQLFGSHGAWAALATDVLPAETTVAMVTCLRCDKKWRSPDKWRCRICPRCTEALQRVEP